MVDQTISYNDKSAARRGRGKEVHNSQKLFFIQKELQLNTKFHYIEVAATLDNYKITLCISKTTVIMKIVVHIGLHSVKTKNLKKKSQDREREREEERVRTRKKRKMKRKRKRK